MRRDSRQTVGVCSWSLRPKHPAALRDALNRLRLDACQLALTPIVDDPANWASAIELLRDAGVRVVSGMLSMLGEDYSTLDSIRETGGVASDALWPTNLDRARRVADLAAGEGIPLVTFHAGFLPHEAADPRRGVMLERLRAVAAAFAQAGVQLGLETGQETADTLLDVLAELDAPNVHVNFDPANMILYGMGDPVAALRALAEHVVQVHVKDARPTTKPGTWGVETPVGEGAVVWPAFLGIVRGLSRPVDLIIEREAGEHREHDIAVARDHVRRLLAAPGAIA